VGNLYPVELQNKPTAPGIRVYMRNMDKLNVILSKYHDNDSLQRMGKHRSQLEGMMQALGLDEKGKSMAESG
jgi:hypothetical protein